MIKTGLSLTVYVSKEELVNAKSGGSTMVASKSKTKEAEYQLSVTLDACDILENEVRVNLTMVRASFEAAGEVMGAAIGAEIQKVFAQLE
ncbi:hypothetical protein [Paenibacillus sp. 7516]|uniref:hypothetical protein n=1 Tax=Paenibacillus sp. 7516 TaxID=2022549 RepID=UPI000BA64E46|nr:hypothetical protein [Paenibacillus sp. 7516]PAF31872.1 hypothetical protein CHI14_09475 [Paenibacillus sp. 7516]